MPDSNTAPLIAPINSSDSRGRTQSTPSIEPRRNWNSQMVDYDRVRPLAVHSHHATIWVVASGIVDWLLIVAAAVGGLFIGNITPNKRPFQLEDPNIS